jgi:hypothetical protein
MSISTEHEMEVWRVDALKHDTGTGWVIGNGDGTKWRMWGEGMPMWTTNIDRATRYHRREDAESVRAEDEDAWTVRPYHSKEPKT